MDREGGSQNVHVCPQGGRGGQKTPKNCPHGLQMTPNLNVIFSTCTSDFGYYPIPHQLILQNSCVVAVVNGFYFLYVVKIFEFDYELSQKLFSSREKLIIFVWSFFTIETNEKIYVQTKFSSQIFCVEINIFA